MLDSKIRILIGVQIAITIITVLVGVYVWISVNSTYEAKLAAEAERREILQKTIGDMRLWASNISLSNSGISEALQIVRRMEGEQGSGSKRRLERILGNVSFQLSSTREAIEKQAQQAVRP